MIDLSLGKLMLLALIALLVLGPEKLPGAARTAGALIRRVRNGWDSVRAEVERELEIEQIKRDAHAAAAQAESLQNEAVAAVKEIREPMEHIVTSLHDVAASAADTPVAVTEPTKIAAPAKIIGDASHGND